MIGTFATDRSRDRSIFFYACCSTALLCPLVFGFPTEMWFAHAVFWPTLSVSHHAQRTIAGTALVCLRLCQRLGRIGSDLGESSGGGSGLIGRLVGIETRMMDLEVALRDDADRRETLRTNLPRN